ncbi:DUF4136 domain-containing protein [Chitinilyticum piscinae]|uniref:DUF4136 domain-containing protein n=1 Tax=Chitinilyticum piscinae TaxID=2866724 RepID=A0A8J7FPH7_9NEIS|nr:DUF4136 domain-containing protein [Chitinilyticum piscinae]MBE9610741.1 DUF4136 domain-containing protein [Chitinilyticum piscinae]
MKRILLCLLVLLCSACAAPNFVAQVSSRSTLPASSPVAGKRFIIETPPGQEQSIARRDFAAQIARELKSRGMTQVGDSQFADWLLRFDWRVSGPVSTTTQYPVHSSIGIFGGGWSWGGIGMSFPIYSESTQTNWYARELTLDIYDPRALKSGQFAKLYEAKASNSSTSNAIEPAVPWLIRAVFQDFPQPGVIRREVRIPYDPATAASNP